eukprot:SAG11_NODE_1653_length_4508_cov_6.277387_4_plen_157_part_00
MYWRARLISIRTADSMLTSLCFTDSGGPAVSTPQPTTFTPDKETVRKRQILSCSVPYAALVGVKHCGAGHQVLPGEGRGGGVIVVRVECLLESMGMGGYYFQQRSRTQSRRRNPALLEPSSTSQVLVLETFEGPTTCIRIFRRALESTTYSRGYRL